MTARQITREEAKRIHAAVADDGPEMYPEQAQRARLALTVMALYDDVDRLDGALATMHRRAIDAAEREAALRECIDRLRDGWVSFGMEDVPTHWSKHGHDLEPMTEAEQAVMAHG